MRFTVTALGSGGGRSVERVVEDIVRYLDPPTEAVAGQSGPSGAPGAADYYADESAEAGRWLGSSATELGLEGHVDAADFAILLAGRHPRTRERLITARGSAGRRPGLARGCETRHDGDGQPLYDLRDAAAALGVEVGDVRRMVEAGAAMAEDPGQGPEPFGGSYLRPVNDLDGTRWVSEGELRRCEEARRDGPDPESVAAAGRHDDRLGVPEAALLAGLSAQYLRMLCRTWTRHRAEIDRAADAGERYPSPFLVAERGARGNWLIRRSDLVEFLRHRRTPAVRVGFDLTLTTEKSLGVLALLGEGETRATVLDAIQAGNDRGLAHLEASAAKARVRGEPVAASGWTVASFRHLTSRALDPFPHHHNVVANTVVDPDGGRRALDARWLYRHAAEAGALATAEMRHQLTRRLGVRWRRGRKGTWEIAGIPDPVLREFSQRSNEVDDAVAELEALIGRTATIGELRRMVTRTRPAKRRVAVEDLRAEWWDRARAHGYEPVEFASCLSGPALPEPPEAEEVFTRLAAPEGICAQGSVFTRAEVITALVAMDSPAGTDDPQPLLLDAADLECLAEAFLDSDHVVELHPEPGREISALGADRLFTTAEMLGMQVRILDADDRGADAGAGVVPDSVLGSALNSHRHLSAEQRDLVGAFCTSGRRVQCGIGRAGSGKTTAMRSAAAAWSAAGYRVMGAAVKGEAARLLGQEAGVPCETLAWYLAHADPARGPLDARTVLIVDEASTVSDRDLARLLWMAEKAGAAVRLIGDPAQHGSVGAGGMFAVLCDRGGTATPELRISHRVEAEADRVAADALREGRIGEALASLASAGHLHVVDDEIDLYLDLLERWWQSRQAGQEHPMVDRRNHTRFQLNRLAHRLLQVTGEIGSAEIAAAGDRRFSVGDRVVTRRGDRSVHPPGHPELWVRNGATGVVVALEPGGNYTRDAIRVDFGGIGTVDLPRSFFDEHRDRGGRREVGLDHAYAVTSYAVQGATFAESTSRIDERASRSEAYVDITRGRSANHLYVTRAADPLDGERLPKAPAPPIAASVTARLSGSGPERAAIDLDPAAQARDTAAEGRRRNPRARR